MQLDIGKAFAQCRPLSLRLLHPVLAEKPLARVENGNDGIGFERLGHGDEVHGRRNTADAAGGDCDAVADGGQVRLCGVGHE